ncbi:uncharacterized protein isoform X2 [Leptinotarsa decemlineata]|uniref:uncharacterized protein isoform X2 n=1 Tax=Leptinotarsa decemlineata TaxID=7539 RepID=UPI003D3058C6
MRKRKLTIIDLPFAADKFSHFPTEILYILYQKIIEMLFVVINYSAFFILISLVGSERFSEKVRVKRSEIDLQTCIDNFNVHKDKIIRTQDSQNMGAKYLNEIDLGSREECLRLCCETENCDVFVFEEKNSGSCYLFHCGPPEDFKCKFTHHVNYSSAVLAINRHLPDLESQIKLTKHEQDLTKLRKPETDPEVLRPIVPEIITTHAPTTTTMVLSKELIPINKPNDVSEQDRKCSRFQFECRSTRECIAIYNACDGIPQCADSSDEAPELGCPYSMTTPLPLPAHVNNPPAAVRYEANIQPPFIPPNTNQQPGYLQPQGPHESGQLQQAASRPEADFLRPANDPRNSRAQYEPVLQPFVPQLPAQPGGSNWISPQYNQMLPQVPQYVDKNSRIFNHKENGYQVPDGQEISQVQYSAENVNGRDYPKMNNYYGDNSYRQPIQQENWPSGGVVYEQRNNPQEESRSQAQNVKNPSGLKSTPVKVPIVRNENANPKHIQESLAQDLKHSKDSMEHGSNVPEKIKITKHVHHEQYPDVVAYKISDENDLEDGIAQTQKGAVLSVSLGLIITFIMAVMIGCRLKMVRRRIRKGGKAYAHDADYLVNGMYL